MLKLFGLESEPSLARLALIVRGADTARPDIAPEAAGLARRIARPVSARGRRRSWTARTRFHGLRCSVRLAALCCRGTTQLAGQSRVTSMATTETTARPSFGEAFMVWLKIGCINFGGPAGQIALMHRVVVDEKKWIDEPRFLHALNFCMLLPGPEAQKLATYLGWLLHGVRGGLSAGILFILPGAFVMLGLSLLYALGRGISAVDGALFGIKAAVLVIVIEALIRIGKRALKTSVLLSLAAAAFVGIFFLALPFPLIVAAAALDRLYRRAPGSGAAWAHGKS